MYTTERWTLNWMNEWRKKERKKSLSNIKYFDCFAGLGLLIKISNTVEKKSFWECSLFYLFFFLLKQRLWINKWMQSIYSTSFEVCFQGLENRYYLWSQSWYFSSGNILPHFVIFEKNKKKQINHTY